MNFPPKLLLNYLLQVFQLSRSPSLNTCMHSCDQSFYAKFARYPALTQTDINTFAAMCYHSPFVILQLMKC